MDKSCPVAGCGKKAQIRGVCKVHYENWRLSSDRGELGYGLEAPFYGRDQRNRATAERKAAERAEKSKKKLEIVHGKYSTYSNKGCRCQECKSAWNEYCTEVRRKTRESWTGVADPSIPHGVTNSYFRHGCRCPDCKDAHNNSSNALQRIKKLEIFKSYALLVVSCEICGSAEKKLVVDHDHSNGEFRGMLCHSCNTAIGKLGDSVDRLKSAIGYLEKTRPW